MRWWAWPVLAAGVIVPVLSYVSVRVAQWLFRWLVDAAKRTIQDAVREMVQDPIREMGDSLGHSLDDLRESNAREHAKTADQLTETNTRLTALEGRVAAMEGHLEAVEGGVYHVAEQVQGGDDDRPHP